ncbi:peptidase S9B family protein [Pleurotus pulmonarius]
MHIPNDGESGGFTDSSERSKLYEHDPNQASSFIRPAIYYGEGPFDPPSSEDEDETLLEKDDALDTNEGPERAYAFTGQRDRLGGRQRPTSMRYLAFGLVLLVSLSAIIGMVAAFTYSGANSYHAPGVKKITMDHVFNGTFAIESETLRWVPEAGDGVFSIDSDGSIMLVDLKTNSSRSLVANVDVKDEHGNPIAWSSWKLSPDMKYLLVKADHRKQWRWSSFGNYYVHNIETRTTRPLTAPSNPPTTAFATWAPTGEAIAYVQSNDLYVVADQSSSPIRVTTSGNASLFHGVPDWVYEEEVFSADSALWFSPDSKKLAFLAFDETLVDEYNFPVYNPTEDSNRVVPYTSDVAMKYPKPGYNNPLVTVHVFDLDKYRQDRLAHNSSEEDGWDDQDTKRPTTISGFPAVNATLELDWPYRQAKENSIILEVAWVGNASLIMKEVNRNADNGTVILFDLESGAGVSQDGRKVTGKLVRKLGKDGEEGDDGWINNEQYIRPIPPKSARRQVNNGEAEAYLDIVPTPEGYNHIALFSPASSSTPHFLTSGPWEVVGGIKGVDLEKGLVYFVAAKPSSIERHLYSVPLPSLVRSAPAESNAPSYEKVEPTELTDASERAYYGVDFSPQAGFYLLSYDGPNIPWQKVVKAGDKEFGYVLTTNERLTNTTEEFEAPIASYGTIESDGYELNFKEIRPPRMDDSGRTKYPVLFRVYGGPNSQMVDLRFERHWHDYLACSLDYVIVIVDGRGTGYKGRKLRNPVKGNLGFWETKDQVNAARLWAAKDYVDPKRIGIWGWSYGGFMASKVVEADAGIHSLSMAVAPVTSWLLYDSIYTERYMNLPKLNGGGYVNASISNVTAFDKVDYLLAHGSADDNVHYANSAHLLDMFTRAQVRKFRFRMFTDSDHSITRRGAHREVYEYLTGFVVEKWGRGGRRRGW